MWNGKEVQEKEEEESLGIGWAGVPSWVQEVPWLDGSSVEEQFEAFKKDELMEQFGKDLGSGAVDTLSKMEIKQAQDVLTKLEENMVGVSEEKKENSGVEFDVNGGKEKGGIAGERGRAEDREKKIEEEGERRESQSKNSETAFENPNG